MKRRSLISGLAALLASNDVTFPIPTHKKNGGNQSGKLKPVDVDDVVYLLEVALLHMAVHCDFDLFEKVMARQKYRDSHLDKIWDHDLQPGVERTMKALGRPDTSEFLRDFFEAHNRKTEAKL